MLVAADDVICFSSNCAFQNAITRRISGDDIECLNRLNALGEGCNLPPRSCDLLFRPNRLRPESPTTA